ncbi:hypothetical protein [Edaphocola flava]|uniref:hypothetical protein n=1 Tax=Edaphocola flava TaxID=2499629 RepID=UPI00100A4CDA|nr:hypothetical protein [Edaphocola flava]
MRNTFYTFLILICSYNSFGQQAVIPKNSLSIVPIATYNRYNWSVGIAYERLIDNKGRWGINIPILYTFMNNYFNVDFGKKNKNWMIVNPGFRYYPIKRKSFTYGAGISYYYVSGQSTDYGIGTPPEGNKYDIWEAGPMLNNYVGFNISQRIHISMEFGIGKIVTLKMRSHLTGKVSDAFTLNEPMTQTNFQISYRF